MQNSAIDVIIPVYNGMPFIEKTLHCVIAQTLRPKKIIVVNDGSTDNTLETLDRLKDENPHVQIEIITKPNGGHSSATNVGIRAATSEYVALLDADDLWHPTKLEKQFSVFLKSQDPKLGIVYTDYINIDLNDKYLPHFPTVKLDPSVKGKVFEALLTRGNLILGSNSAVLMKRQVFLDHGFFDENLRCGEDWEMWIRLAQTYHYDFYPEPLTLIRRHSGNLSNQKMLHCKSDLYILHKWRKSLEEIQGRFFIINYLARISFQNLKTICFSLEYKFLLKSIGEMAHFQFPKLLLLWSSGLKIYNKFFKILKRI